MAEVTEADLLSRTKAFSPRVLSLVNALPRTPAGRAIASQLVRSARSGGANYRSACRARSAKEFASRLGVVEEEADEAVYWIELVAEGGLVSPSRLDGLHDEAVQLCRIMAASHRSARVRAAASKNRKSQIENRK